MEKQIFDIGSGKYYFDRNTLDSFIEEARDRSSSCASRGSDWARAAEGAGPSSDQETSSVFEEVMSLYYDYLQRQNVESLVKLKSRLEEFSVRYHSYVLAEEVMHINSCLPYELRIPGAGDKS